jgi:hypothetical protein
MRASCLKDWTGNEEGRLAKLSQALYNASRAKVWLIRRCLLGVGEADLMEYTELRQ